MKTISMLIALFFIGLSANAQFSKATLQASGLTCAMCSKAVKVALEEVSFVQDVKVDIKKQEYSINFKENSDPDFDALKNAVEDAGFSVASLKVTGVFSGISVPDDKHVQINGKNFHFISANKQVLNGETTLTIVDKNFTSEKEYKKLSSVSKMECVKTGKAAGCCSKDGMLADSRVYHVKI
jgi:copper chaperone CopZ